MIAPTLAVKAGQSKLVDGTLAVNWCHGRARADGAMTGRHSCRRENPRRCPWTALLMGLGLVLSLAGGALPLELNVLAQTAAFEDASSDVAMMTGRLVVWPLRFESSGRRVPTAAGRLPVDLAQHQHEMESHPAPVWSAQPLLLGGHMAGPTSRSSSRRAHPIPHHPRSGSPDRWPAHPARSRSPLPGLVHRVACSPALVGRLAGWFRALPLDADRSNQ